MDLPHVNILTKIDKISSYDPLPFDLNYYTDVQDLTYLQRSLEDESPAMRSDRWTRLNTAVADMIESFGLVRFEVLAVENKRSMMHILRVIDRAGGYVFGGAEGANDTVWQVAMRDESSMLNEQDLQERWIDNKEAYDEVERKEWEQQERQRQADEAELRDEAGGEVDLPVSMPQTETTGAATANPDDDDIFDEDFPRPLISDNGITVVRKTKE